VRAALESGDLSQDDVKEILLQQTIYCGVPAANTAFKEARELFDAMARTPKAKQKKKK
jgi:4-carboxymuconolactone decarboxylase